MFRVGQKVVCIETWIGKPGAGHGDEIGPVEGGVYTIRDVGIGLHPGYPDVLQVRLCEIKNRVGNYVGGIYELAFGAFRFRPIVERKTDISIFTAMLTPSRKKERA